MYPLFSFSNANIYIIIQKFKGNLWCTIRYVIKYTSAKKFVTICQCLKSVGFSRSSSLDDKMVTCQVEWKILRTILEGFFSDVLRQFHLEVLQNYQLTNLSDVFTNWFHSFLPQIFIGWKHFFLLLSLPVEKGIITSAQSICFLKICFECS